MTAAPTPGTASRRAAWEALRLVHVDRMWSQQAVDAALRASDLDTRDRAFAANLAYSTLRFEGSLDAELTVASSRPLAEVDPGLLDVLRMGAWQLRHGGVPDRAAVGTAVEVARAVVGGWSTGFCNGVLRTVARSDPPRYDESTDEGLGLALGYPAWIVASARGAFGARARAVLAAGNVPAGITLRAAPGGRAALLDELRADGIEARPTAAATDGVGVGHLDVGALPAVAEGRAAVQDEASMLVVEALAEAAGGLDGASAVDLCAAPGGKTAHLAALGAEVVAVDRDARRLPLVAEAAARLGVAERVRTVRADALTADLAVGAADFVLLDAPCTGLGVVRRRPELRWRRRLTDVAELATLQGRLLDAAVRLVRPGGLVAYSVCTWTGEETVDVVSSALARSDSPWELAGPPASVGGAGSTVGPLLRLDPDRDGTDGMAIALIRRR